MWKPRPRRRSAPQPQAETRSTVESVCRSILIELGLGLPEKKDIKGLFAAVRKPLGLGIDRDDLDPLIADDVRKILNGLATVIEGIGSLRTHGGDAHGRERGYTRIDRRIASLATFGELRSTFSD